MRMKMSELLTLEMARELEKVIEGEVKVDRTSKVLYSTDASIYRVEPLGVVFPRRGDDLIAIVQFASKHEVPLLARGSGSSLAGQTVGPALVVDCSKYLNKVLEIHPEERKAVVEPGVVLNAFNQVAAAYGLKYGPDPASSDRATFGGMIGNNSTGAHSVQFGMTSDHIVGLDVVLSDGSSASLGETSLDEVEILAKKTGRLGDFTRTALKIRREYSAAIQSSWPKTWRNSSGYALNYLLPWSASQPPFWGKGSYPPVREGSINLAKLFVGSEGTLGVFQRAIINLVPTPRVTALGVLAFDGIAEACDAAPSILDRNPSAVELIPRALINRARSVPAYASQLFFVKGDPAAILVVEFEGDNLPDLVEKVKALRPDVVLADSPEKQAKIWSVRKVGLGLLMSVPGDTKPIPFIEDIAVPVERLGDFVRGCEKVMAEYGTSGDYYAHASSGCLHVRPLINLKTQTGIEVMRGITEEFVKLSTTYGGALSGEHGDGQARAEWLTQVYGEGVVEAFGILKRAADPQGILNPGKVVDPEPMDRNLRYGVGYRSSTWIPLLDFSSQESIAGAIEMCNGAGVCRKASGVMCPSFQALGDETHSTRGRANLLRAMISGIVDERKMAEAAAHEALDLCLECKGCKAECPSGVDMAKLKYEFLNHYYQSHRRPVKDYVFAYIGVLGKLGQTFHFAFPLIDNPIGKSLLDALFGISRKRDLPKPTKADNIKLGELEQPGEQVIFLSDPFTEYFYPELKQDALEVLSHLEISAIVLPIIGSGRTMISKGFLNPAREHAGKVISEIRQIDPDGKMPVVGVEPSEVTTLRDEYLSFFPGDPGVAKLANRTYLIDEFLIRPNKDGTRRIDQFQTGVERPELLLHGHCYQKSQSPLGDNFPSGVDATVELLRAAGCDVEVIESGCCGMAGSFGYEADHFELSMQVGELALFPAIRGKRAVQEISASGISCRTQIQTGTGEKASHPISILAGMLRGR